MTEREITAGRDLEPLILPRPEFTSGIEYAGNGDRHAYTTRLGAKVAIGCRHADPVELDPDAAFEFAAHIAVNAEAARAGEPDPAEVDDLAHEIRLALCADSDRLGLRLSDSDRAAARAALAWMKNREPAS